MEERYGSEFTEFNIVHYTSHYESDAQILSVKIHIGLRNYVHARIVVRSEAVLESFRKQESLGSQLIFPMEIDQVCSVDDAVNEVMKEELKQREEREDKGENIQVKRRKNEYQI